MHLSPDAASIGHNNYRAWFYFGIKGLKKGAVVRISVVNLTFMRVFTNQLYRPVWRVLPFQSEWRRIEGDILYEPTYTTYYKYSWSFEVTFNDSEYFFAYAPPYSYSEIAQSISEFQCKNPDDCSFTRETLIKSLDGRNLELLTISHKSNFSEVTESALPDLFPDGGERCKIAKKPIVFISARVHPGETPASYVLDGVLQMLLSNDPRGLALRSAFVFKIIPVLNPDGVYRGNFRVDQNGINLNRCYVQPNLDTQPTIYAAKTYTEYLGSKVKYYFDLHAHASKRSCFLFGNYLELEKQVENQLFAKLIELNSLFFEYSECDFSERSMMAKDPKDHHSKEGSGRVAQFNTLGLVHSYTVECSYFITRSLHVIPSPIYVKNGRRFSEVFASEKYLTNVYNRNLFTDIANGVLFAILDIEKINPISRLPLSEFRFVEAAKEWIRARILAQTRLMGKKLQNKNEMLKAKKYEKITAFPKIAVRKVHKMSVITSIYPDILQSPNKPKVLFCLGKSNKFQIN